MYVRNTLVGLVAEKKELWINPKLYSVNSKTIIILSLKYPNIMIPLALSPIFKYVYL